MIFQAVILAACESTSTESRFQKCRTPISGDKSLLEVCVETYRSSKNIVVAVNSDDYQHFIPMYIADRIQLVNISHLTEGALATSGMCLDMLDDETPIVVSAVDGICFKIVDKFVAAMHYSAADGGVIVFPSENQKYSYVRVNHSIPIEFAEKVRIGELASSGIYYFRNKRILIDAILWAILNQVRFEDTYYFSSAMNKLIVEGLNVELFQVEESDYFRFSTPAEAERSINRMRELDWKN